jgi:hypothetical protein
MAWLLGTCLSLVVVLVLSRAQAWGQVRNAEHPRLLTLAAAAEESLARRLDTVHAALAGVRDDSLQWLDEGVAVGVTRRMRALKAAMTGVRQLAWLDARGKLLASSTGPAERLSGLPASLLVPCAQAAGAGVLHLSVSTPSAQGVGAVASLSFRPRPQTAAAAGAGPGAGRPAGPGGLCPGPDARTGDRADRHAGPEA